MRITKPQKIKVLFSSGTPCFARFMMNGCGACEESQDDWDQLGRSSLPIFLPEIESALSHHSPVPVTGYPTYVFYDGKKAAPVNIGRDVASMTNFLKRKLKTFKKTKRRQLKNRSKKR